MSLDMYRNMLRYADSKECPIEKRINVIEGANEIINALYKSWADSQPDPFAYEVVKKESVGYVHRLIAQYNFTNKAINL